MILAAAVPALAAESLLERLTDTYLAALRRQARPVRQAARPTPRTGNWEDVRTVLHAHSGLSHDSRGTAEELAAAAKAAGVRAVFMTEHPTPDRRWWNEGLRGDIGGVLFVRGAELSSGLLVWRSDGANWTPEMSARDVLTRLDGTAGVSFIAHPELKTADADWDLPAFHGMEIYNTHADALDNNYEQTLNSLRTNNPLRTLTLVNTLKKYPREAFAAIFDEQTGVLQRWDRLNVEGQARRRRVIGIAANDAHSNVGITVVAADTDVEIRDGLDAVVSRTAKSRFPPLLFGDLSRGSVLLSHRFDPYPISLGYVSTHLLAAAVTEEDLFSALLAGRAYVAFDWLADPSGFRFAAETAAGPVEMGGETQLTQQPRLVAQANMPCVLRLLRNGEELQRVEQGELTAPVTQAGVYRLEAWVRLGETLRPWIYTNPIYVR